MPIMLLIESNASLQTPEQLHSEKVPQNLIPHKVMITYNLNWCIMPTDTDVAFLTRHSFASLFNRLFRAIVHH
jgi:hypothetical protein